MTCILATSRLWNDSVKERLEEATGEEFVLITSKDVLTWERLESIRPNFVFFPHWSYIIPAEIYEHFTCVIFHMTDLPYGRGGSPLQNLIARGIFHTKLTALRCVGELDAGPVYLKKDLELFGGAEEIYLRAFALTEFMIVEILATRPEPVEQSGEVVAFKRRKPEDGDLAQAQDLGQWHDFIRMLDAEGYPPAFLNAGGFRLEFSHSVRRQDRVEAHVTICKIE